MKKLPVGVAIVSMLLGGTAAYGATQPQTMTICIDSPVPIGWIVTKTILTGDCPNQAISYLASPGSWGSGPVYSKVDSKIITPIQNAIGQSFPWTFAPVTTTATGLTLFRSNGQQHQVCKISVTATTASFACADVTATTVSLAELLKK